MVLLHDDLRFVLSMIVHDSHHILSNLDLAAIGLQVDIDWVVATYLMTVENLHSARRDSQALGEDEILRSRKQKMTLMVFIVLLSCLQIKNRIFIRVYCPREGYGGQWSLGGNSFRVEHCLLLIGRSFKHTSDSFEQYFVIFHYFSGPVISLLARSMWRYPDNVLTSSKIDHGLHLLEALLVFEVCLSIPILQ